MTSRSLRVEFLPTDTVAGVRPEDPRAEVHDVSLPDGIDGVPELLENPHVDFPGTWRLVGDGVEGAHRYQRVDRLGEDSSTRAG
jgi:hypothetical protein